MGFSSSAREDLRFILKTLWSDDLCTDLAAATAQYRADTRNRVTDKAPRERREGRRDLSRLERASSRCRANLEALTPGLRKKIIVGVGPYLGSSVGTWMAGFDALGRYLEHLRGTSRVRSGRPADVGRRRFALAVQRIFRKHGIPVRQSRDGVFAQTLTALLFNTGAKIENAWHLLPGQFQRTTQRLDPPPKAAPALRSVPGWTYTLTARLPSPRRTLQAAISETVDLPRSARSRLLADLTWAVTRFGERHQPEAPVRMYRLDDEDRTALRRAVTSCTALARELDALEHEHGLFNLHPDDWTHVTGYKVPSDEWREGLLMVAAECDTLRRAARPRGTGRPPASERDALALDLAEIFTRHGVRLEVSRKATPFTRLIMRCLQLTGVRAPKDPYRLLRRLADELPAYAAERQRRRNFFDALLTQHSATR